MSLYELFKTHSHPCCADLVIWFNLQCKKVQVEYCITISPGVCRQELQLHAFCFVWIFFELEMRMDMSSIERSSEKR